MMTMHPFRILALHVVSTVTFIVLMGLLSAIGAQFSLQKALLLGHATITLIALFAHLRAELAQARDRSLSLANEMTVCVVLGLIFYCWFSNFALRSGFGGKSASLSIFGLYQMNPLSIIIASTLIPAFTAILGFALGRILKRVVTLATS